MFAKSLHFGKLFQYCDKLLVLIDSRVTFFEPMSWFGLFLYNPK